MNVIDKEKLNTIEENVPKVYHSGRFNAIKDSTYLKGSESGEHIYLDDVSDIEHTVGVKVSSKNIIPYPYTHTTKEGTENSWVDNGDGTITYSGTNINGEATFYLLGTELNNLLIDGETYTVSLGTDKSFSYPLVVILAYNLETKTNTWLVSQTLNTPKKTFTVNKSKYRYDRLYMQVDKGSNGGKAYDVVCKPQLELGSVVTPFTLNVPDVTELGMRACGKNLIPYPYSSPSLQNGATTNGITCTINEDNSITLNGTATTSIYPSIAKIFLPVGPYSLSGVVGGGYSTFAIDAYTKLADGTKQYLMDIGKGREDFTIEVPQVINFRVVVNAGTVLNNVTIKPQVETGKKITEYEKYCGATYNPNAEGTVEGVKSIATMMNIFADTEGVKIDCEYNADTKKYIDNKFAELQALVLEG